MSFLSNSSPLNWHTTLKGLKKEGRMGDMGRDLGFIGGKVKKYIEDFKMPQHKGPSLANVRELAAEEEGKRFKEVVERTLALQPHQGWATGKKVHKKTLKMLVKESLPSGSASAAAPGSPSTVPGSDAHTVGTGQSAALELGLTSPMLNTTKKALFGASASAGGSNAAAGASGGGGGAKPSDADKEPSEAEKEEQIRKKTESVKKIQRAARQQAMVKEAKRVSEAEIQQAEAARQVEAAKSLAQAKAEAKAAIRTEKEEFAKLQENNGANGEVYAESLKKSTAAEAKVKRVAEANAAAEEQAKAFLAKKAAKEKERAQKKEEAREAARQRSAAKKAATPPKTPRAAVTFSSPSIRSASASILRSSSKAMYATPGKTPAKPKTPAAKAAKAKTPTPKVEKAVKKKKEVSAAAQKFIAMGKKHEASKTYVPSQGPPTKWEDIQRKNKDNLLGIAAAFKVALAPNAATPDIRKTIRQHFNL